MDTLAKERTTVHIAPYFRNLSFWIAGYAAITMIVAMFLLDPVLGPNDGSRWNTVWSLTHKQGYIIDQAPYGTPDKVKRDGHFYSSKPPLLPTMIAGLVWIIRSLTGWDLPSDANVVVRLVLILLNVLPYGIVVLLYGRHLEKQNFSPQTSAICLTIACWGTYLSSYSVTLNNHTVAACACFFTLHHLMRINYEGRKEWWHFILCGLFAAWTAVNELPAVAFGLCLFVCLVREHPKQTLSCFIPPAAIVLGAHFVTTWLATGGLLPDYVRFNTPLYHYENSYWNNPYGIDAANDPRWFYLFNFTLGHHGMLSLTPVFFLSLYGMVTGARWKGICRMGLFLTGGLLVFYAITTNNYGGGCHGPRWLLWLIPFWLIPLAPVVESHFKYGWFRWLTYGCVAISMGSSILAATGEAGPWRTSWIHLFMRTLGWIDY